MTNASRLRLLPRGFLPACAVALAGASACGSPSRAPRSGAPHEVRFVQWITQRAAGRLTVVTDGREQRITYQYDHGSLGPRLEERVVLDGDRVVVRTTRGLDYFKSPVEEELRDDGATLTWRNDVERGSQPSGAIYPPVQATPVDAALLVRELLAAGGAAPLAPSGEARVTEIERSTIRARGERREVILYAVTGLGLAPDHVWLEGGTLFARIRPGWMSLVREGWEEVLPTLETRQLAAAREHERRLAALARRVDAPVAFRDVRVFDARAGRTVNGQTVVVRGDRIEQVGPSGKIAIPGGALVIDGTGRTVLPGLWDMHVHVASIDGGAHLAAGVTSVRDLANDTDMILELRAAWDRGERIGPRVILGGIIDGPGPLTGPTKVVVDTEEDAVATVARYADLGYEQIKIYGSLHRDLVPVIIHAAHERHLRVSGHVPGEMTATEAVRAGFDEIQHADMLLLDFMRDVAGDTRDTARFTAIGKHAAGIDLQSPEARAFIALLRERGTVVDPTLTLFEWILTSRPGQPSPRYAAVIDRWPIALQRRYRTGGLPVDPELDPRFRASFGKMLELVGLLHRAGVPLVVGTDTLAGFTLHRELELYVAAGIPAGEALSIATLGAARVMKRERELGTIEPGKLADLVLVDGDPSAQISDIRNTALTMKGGVLFAPDAIYAALGVRHPVRSPLRTR